MHKQRSLTWLLLFAVLGFAVPGGLFLYWAANDFTTLAAALRDRLALAFIADLLITTGALTVYFAKRPAWALSMALVSRTLTSGHARVRPCDVLMVERATAS
jgi:hypothetical protein